ncbi:MAG: hypothetical protein RJA25_184 [Bacteroidota bacterium]|jgi:glycosyltransferase involved in cell wall biosynthesis
MYLPMISIITPVFNNEQDIAHCIDSVAAQTYQYIEHIIIDGNSTDATLSIIKTKASKNSTLKFISENDNGIYDAMNKGIQMASGDFLYFMGSDDVFYANSVLENIIQDLEGNDLVYGNVFFKHKKIVYDGAFNKTRIIDQSICHQAAFFSKRTFASVGMYDTKLKLAGDWDLFLRCFYHKNISIKYIDTIICLYDESGASGQNSENRITKYLTLYKRVGVFGIMKYWFIQIEKKLGRKSFS